MMEMPNESGKCGDIIITLAENWNFKLLIKGWQQMMYLLNLPYDFCKEG
jgi:hypothetical protein